MTAVRVTSILLCVAALSGCAGAGRDSSPGGEAKAVWPWPDLPEAAALRRNPQVRRYQCLTCHTVGNVGGSVGSTLNQVGLRRDREWLRRWMRNPAAMKPKTAMLKVELPEKELDRLIDGILALARPVDAKRVLAEAASPEQAGEKLMRAYDCFACHKLGGEGRFVGPDLTWIGFRKSREWETTWLRNPGAFKPGTFMPNFHLTEAELNAITAYLATLQGQRHAETQDWKDPMIGDIDRGEIVFRKFGCNGCHGDRGEGGWPNPGARGGKVTTLTGVAEGYTRDELVSTIRAGRIPDAENPDAPPPFRMPDWGARISEQEMNYLVTYLFSLNTTRTQDW